MNLSFIFLIPNSKTEQSRIKYLREVIDLEGKQRQYEERKPEKKNLQIRQCIYKIRGAYKNGKISWKQTT